MIIVLHISRPMDIEVDIFSVRENISRFETLGRSSMLSQQQLGLVYI